MNVLEKFNIVPLSRLPQNNLPPVPKKESILPVILTITGLAIIGAFAFYYFRKNSEEESSN
jgi:hypothetical protein